MRGWQEVLAAILVPQAQHEEEGYCILQFLYVSLPYTVVQDGTDRISGACVKYYAEVNLYNVRVEDATYT